jgi:pimeloyl-ACP methyl ester carboxylesterase
VGTLAATGFAVARVRLRVPHDVPLPHALSGERRELRGKRSGGLSFYAAGPDRPGTAPLLLIHSINAAASSYEMRPLYDRFAATRRVIALDLPGFGFSERSDRVYTPALMRDAILDLAEDALGGGPVDAVALSLGAEALALAAHVNPAAFRSLAFLTPTGFSVKPPPSPRPALHRFLRMPPWSRPLFDALTSRPSIRYFLQATQRERVAPETVEYAWATSHQPNAELAPYAFLTFQLFTRDVFRVYEALSHDCLLLYGKDPYGGFEKAAGLWARTNWRIVPLLHAGSLVHWDEPARVCDELERHFATATAADARAS